MAMQARYRRPGWFTQHIFNRLVLWLTRRGLGIAGARVLEVRGRKSGEWRRTPVNLLAYEGARYLVAPRGETQWVRNLRVNPEGRLLVGRRAETFTAKEIVAEGEKIPLLRAYLRRWRWEVGVFFDRVDADSPESDLRRIAPHHPAFRLE